MQKHQQPNFIIVGTQKGGTSSLYSCLTQHPSVMPASKKEIHYFSQYYHQGMDWYLEHFPVRPNSMLSGEASPYYLFHPLAAERIAKDFPHIKIIIMLRNPAQRAISHYHQQARRKHEKLSMLEAFTNEEQRIAKSWQRLLDGDNLHGATVQQCSYLKRGQYLEQLLRFEKHFPSEQIHLLESEQFFSQPLDTLSAVFEFLQIDSTFTPPDLWPRKPGNYEKIDEDITCFLENYFKGPNQALFQYLGQEFNW